jgi:uncharacterized protein (DUF924 family)
MGAWIPGLAKTPYSITRLKGTLQRTSREHQPVSSTTGPTSPGVALILLLDQFRRNIYRGTAKAFEKDKAALKLCVEGAMGKTDRGLAPIHRVFFYMPLQHAESRKVQAKSRKIYERLAAPHRNKLLNRENNPEEDEYLADDSPGFGQG